MREDHHIDFLKGGCSVKVLFQPVRSGIHLTKQPVGDGASAEGKQWGLNKLDRRKGCAFNNAVRKQLNRT